MKFDPNSVLALGAGLFEGLPNHGRNDWASLDQTAIDTVKSPIRTDGMTLDFNYDHASFKKFYAEELTHPKVYFRMSNNPTSIHRLLTTHSLPFCSDVKNVFSYPPVELKSASTNRRFGTCAALKS